MPIPIIIGAAAAATYTVAEIVAIVAGSAADGAGLGAGGLFLKKLLLTVLRQIA